MKRTMAGIPAALTTLALLAAALPAVAGEPQTAATGQHKTDARVTAVARAAHAEAVAQAADAVVRANRLELDIRLVGLTSVQAANDLR